MTIQEMLAACRAQYEANSRNFRRNDPFDTQKPVFLRAAMDHYGLSLNHNGEFAIPDRIVRIALLDGESAISGGSGGKNG